MPSINLELFCCAGGMAEGFRRAGVHFDVALDFAPDHCDSYERNLGHRPIAMDVRDTLRLVRAGHLQWDVDLLVADPPCTPWSRAGKRLGTADERDMLEVTCDLIAELRPRRYLIGNVPGLDDAVNLAIVQRVIGGLSRYGYCTADFARLDAANYGVPQHRVRPFWFGHLAGPCIRWPAPTHCDPLNLCSHALPGIEPLKPWVTCRQALGHLAPDDLGRPVKMRKPNAKHKPSEPSEPSGTIGAKSRGNGACAIAVTRHDEPVHTSDIDSPARSITTQCRAPGHATTIMLREPSSKDPAATPDEPSPTIKAGGGHTGPHVMLTPESGRKVRRTPRVPQSERSMPVDQPATTVQAREDRKGSGSSVLDWPWPRPATTVTSRPGLAPPGHHDESFAIMSLPDAVILSERAAAILQGFPEGWHFAGDTKKARWSQIGQAMPPALAEAVARSVMGQDAQAWRDQAEIAEAG